jgi:hypothetical protein
VAPNCTTVPSSVTSAARLSHWPPKPAEYKQVCGTQLRATAKFCSGCGTPVMQAAQSAEYKQVTVLFADVVRSMDLAQ